MTEKLTTPKKLTAIRVDSGSRWSIVWVVPLVALALSIWLIYHHFVSHGPIAEVKFDTAEGLYPNKTEVRCRSVKVGVVKNIKLADNLSSVTTYLEFEPEYSSLLRRGSRFWVVKARFSPTEFSGLGTLITGAYIETDPGLIGEKRCVRFRGLENPPTTKSSAPGMRIVLKSEESSYLAVGAPVFYRGFEVGRIESINLSKTGVEVSYNIFVNAKYSSLINSNTVFWNTSGIDVSASAAGFRLHTPTLQAMISGGISIGYPHGKENGVPAKDGEVFQLYEDEDTAMNSTFTPNYKILLFFDQTVRGLAVKAPVELRGIVVGRVENISFELAETRNDKRIPVLIDISPETMAPMIGVDKSRIEKDFIKKEVAKGLRASLKSVNFFAGQVFVDLDYYPNAEAVAYDASHKYPAIPTVTIGLSELQNKITSIVDKIQAMPIDEAVQNISALAGDAKQTIANANVALKEFSAAMTKLNQFAGSNDFQALPKDVKASLDKINKLAESIGPDGSIQGDVLRTLEELRASLRSLKSAVNKIEEKPNSLIFGHKSSRAPTPKASRN